jgi:hypothetical protein
MGPFYSDAMSESETPKGIEDVSLTELPSDIKDASSGIKGAKDEGHKYSVICESVNARVLEDYELKGVAHLPDGVHAFFWPV